MLNFSRDVILFGSTNTILRPLSLHKHKTPENTFQNLCKTYAFPFQISFGKLFLKQFRNHLRKHCKTPRKAPQHSAQNFVPKLHTKTAQKPPRKTPTATTSTVASWEKRAPDTCTQYVGQNACPRCTIGPAIGLRVLGTCCQSQLAKTCKKL